MAATKEAVVHFRPRGEAEHAFTITSGKKARIRRSRLEAVENSFGVFRQQAAACCAHGLSAKGGQPAHLQAGVYFSRRTRRREK